MPKALLIMMALGAAAIWIALGVWLPWWLIGVTAGACAIGLAVTPAGRRTASITAAGIATLPQRLGGASVALVGIAGVVGVLIALLAMGNGFRATLQATGNDETAIVLSLGSVSEIGSMLDQTALKLAATAMRAMRLRVVDTLAGW
jgi:putative ABC transport system permease protein